MSAYDRWKCTPDDYWQDYEPEMICEGCDVFMDLINNNEFRCPECRRIVNLQGDEREPAEVHYDDDGDCYDI